MIPRGLGLGVINLIYFLHRHLTRVMLKMWSICVGHPLVSLGLGCIYLAFFLSAPSTSVSSVLFGFLCWGCLLSQPPPPGPCQGLHPGSHTEMSFSTSISLQKWD